MFNGSDKDNIPGLHETEAYIHNFPLAIAPQDGRAQTAGRALLPPPIDPPSPLFEQLEAARPLS